MHVSLNSYRNLFCGGLIHSSDTFCQTLLHICGWKGPEWQSLKCIILWSPLTFPCQPTITSQLLCGCISTYLTLLITTKQHLHDSHSFSSVVCVIPELLFLMMICNITLSASIPTCRMVLALWCLYFGQEHLQLLHLAAAAAPTRRTAPAKAFRG